MKKITLLAAIVLALPSVMQASTVTFSSTNAGPSVFTAANVGTVAGLVPNGSLIRIGTLIGGTTSAFFVEFGTSTVKNAGAGSSARPSKVNGSSVNTGGEADDAQFNGKAIYLWIYNSVTASATADQGIFITSVLFPNNDLGGVGDAATVLAASSFTDVLAIEGFTTASFNYTGDNATPQVPGTPTLGGQLILGTAVPEVSTSILLLSCVGFMGFRRRR